MSIGYLNALGQLHRAYSHYPPSARAHILIRFLTAPFLRTLDEVPAGSRVLEIGAGHGSYAELLTRNGKVREVIAVEPDLRKSLLPMKNKAVRWVAGFDSCIRGEFDAVVIYDATYRIPIPDRVEMYRRSFERLKPGGVFVLKDLDPEHKLKMSWARFQEWLSDHFLHISIGSGFIYQTRSEVEETLRAIGFEKFTPREIDRGYLHSHIIYTARKPA